MKPTFLDFEQPIAELESKIEELRYVQTESEIIEGIRRGMEDARAGRVVPHDEAMRRVRATIARAGRKRA